MGKHHDLIVHTTDPLNAEPPLQILGEHFITPQELFYIRTHGNVPDIDSDSYRLSVIGLVNHELQLSYDALKNNFAKETVMATVQCAGNRRTELLSVAPIPGEVPWLEGAVGNATWSGVRLKEILLQAGVKAETKFVEFMGTDDVFRNNENVGFGASIPIDKAMSDEVLLAYEMNGQPLDPIHGFPIRTIVPGYIGARSVKWLSRITLQAEPSKNYFQDRAYRLFPPDANPESVDWKTGMQLSHLDINCVISSPENNHKTDQGLFKVKGFAISKGGTKISSVEISINGGESWISANLLSNQEKWAWTFWEREIHFSKGQHEIIARASDSESGTQPQSLEQVWNFKGYMNNAWHKVVINVG